MLILLILSSCLHLAAVPIVQDSEDAREAYAFAAGLHDRGFYDRAARAFADFIKKYPKDSRLPRAHFYLGVSLSESTQDAAAIPHFRKYLETGGELAFRAHLRLGELLVAAGKHGEAAPHLEAAANQNDDRVVAEAAAYFLGECRNALSETDKARAAYRRAIEVKGPGVYAPYASNALGFLELANRRFEEALAAFRASELLTKETAILSESRTMTGECLVRLERFDEAARHLESHIRGESGASLTTCRLILARAHLGRKDAKAVMKIFSDTVSGEFRDGVNAALIGAAARFCEWNRRDEALQLLDMVRDPSPSEAEDLNYWRGTAQAASDPAASIQSLRAAANAPGASPRRRFALADACSKAGQHEESLAIYEALRREKTDPDLAHEAAYGAAFSLSRLDRRAEAIKILKEVAGSAPNTDVTWDALFALGENYFALKNYRDAELAYARIVEVPGGRNREEAFFKAAWCAYAMNQFDAALGVIEAFKREYPKSVHVAEAAYLAGKCHEGAGRGDEARTAFLTLAETRQDGDFAARCRVAAADIARRSGRPQQAVDSFRAAIKTVKSPDLEFSARLGLAEALLDQGQHPEAEVAYRTMEERFPKHPRLGDIVLGRAWTAREAGRFQEARELALRARELAGDEDSSGEASYVEALAETGLGSHEEAEVAARRVSVLKNHPRRLDADLLRGRALMRLKRPGDALKVFQGLSDAKVPEVAVAALYEAAFACDVLGEPDERDRRFEKIAKEYPDTELAADSWFRLGESAYSRSDWQGANKFYEAAANHPQNPSLRDRAVYKSGFCLRNLNNSKGAAEQFAKVADSESPLAAEAAWLAGEEFEKSADFESALKKFLHLASKYPQHELSRDSALRAVLMESRLERHDQVIKRAPGALGLGGDPAWVLRVHLALGDAFLATKAFERARSAYRQVTRLTEGPSAARAQFQIAVTFVEAGQIETALDEYLKLTILYAYEEWRDKATLAAAGLLVQTGKSDRARVLLKDLAADPTRSAAAAQAALLLKQIDATK